MAAQGQENASHLTISRREYDRLVWQAGIETKDIEVGDELILRVKVVQVQPGHFGADARICIEDGSGMLSPVRVHTIISHFPMNDAPRNVTPAPSKEPR